MAFIVPPGDLFFLLLSALLVQQLGSSFHFSAENRRDPWSVPPRIDDHVNMLDRRRVLAAAVGLIITSVTPKRVTALQEDPASFEVPSVSSLAFDKILGQGSFKTVYLVSTSSAHGSGSDDVTPPATSYALAVERLRNKADTKDGLRSIQIAEQLHEMLPRNQGRYFETVDDWWFQSKALPEFQPGVHVFSNDVTSSRTKKPPTKFIGKTWLQVSLKPVYDIDLRNLMLASPSLYLVGDAHQQKQVVAGMALSEEFAFRLVSELCEAGRIMHSVVGLVHRDIKPKNIMLLQGSPVIIDFGFSRFVHTERGLLCIDEPGKIKGESDYILGNDAAQYRGCAEGDAYAMGKTIYEVLFGSAHGDDFHSASSPISSAESLGQMTVSISPTLTGAAKYMAQNVKFRALLSGANHGVKRSRFELSASGFDTILSLIQGLCREEKPFSFSKAVGFMESARSLQPIFD